MKPACASDAMPRRKESPAVATFRRRQNAGSRQHARQSGPDRTNHSFPLRIVPCFPAEPCGIRMGIHDSYSTRLKNKLLTAVS